MFAVDPVEIVYDDGSIHQAVEVAGEFTKWERVPLNAVHGSPKFVAFFDNLEIGKPYMYKFIIDGRWSLHPDLDTVRDSVGNENHILIVQPSTTASSISEPQLIEPTSSGPQESFEEIKRPGSDQAIVDLADASSPSEPFVDLSKSKASRDPSGNISKAESFTDDSTDSQALESSDSNAGASTDVGSEPASGAGEDIAKTEPNPAAGIAFLVVVFLLLGWIIT